MRLVVRLVCPLVKGKRRQRRPDSEKPIRVIGLCLKSGMAFYDARNFAFDVCENGHNSTTLSDRKKFRRFAGGGCYSKIGNALGSSVRRSGDSLSIDSIAALICRMVHGIVTTEKTAFSLLCRLWLTVSMFIFWRPMAVVIIPVTPGRSSVEKVMLYGKSKWSASTSSISDTGGMFSTLAP